MIFKNRIDEIDALKKQIDARRPLSTHETKQLKEYFRIGLTYSSNALEGNTLTETETKVILEDGLTIGGKTMREHYEVIGHSKAFDLMVELSKHNSIAEQDILNLHGLFYMLIDQSQAGVYRHESVIVTGTDFVFPKPEHLALMMQDFIVELSSLRQQQHPAVFAAIAHLKLVTIHPFIDGNGRTARLLMNLLLMQQGYVITIIPPVMRSHYLAIVRKGNKGDHTSFVNFISEMVYESHKEYLRMICS